MLGAANSLEGDHSQESKRQYHNNRELCAGIHLHVPHEEDRKYTKDPIRDSRDCTMCVGNVGYHRSSQTMRVSCTWLTFSHPEIACWCALKDKKEEIHGTEHQDKSSCEVYNDTLVFFAGEPKEVSGDGEFRDGGRHNVEEFRDEDYLRCVSSEVCQARVVLP